MVICCNSWLYVDFAEYWQLDLQNVLTSLFLYSKKDTKKSYNLVLFLFISLKYNKVNVSFCVQFITQECL